MRVGAAALAGGIFGTVGTLCFLLAFGTDYWLVASDNCGPFAWSSHTSRDKDANGTEWFLFMQIRYPCRKPAWPHDVAYLLMIHYSCLSFRKMEVKIHLEEVKTASPPSLTLHHEGFFWRCVFQVEPTTHAFLATLLPNQPESKLCIHGYLFPLPVALGQVPHPIYDATAVFRGFWTILIIFGLVSALAGGFLLVCGVPFFSHKLYKLGGAFLLTAACLFLLMLLLYVLWMEVVDVQSYILQERGDSCANPQVSALYGLSFMAAAAGVPLEIVSGLLFLVVARALGASK